ncbi:MAG: UDP-N-acetylmuramoyl-tripeptide--D-alanyl-D-alanine ligase [Ignavibacteriales bacterium]|nr:UDP-N-acetylmuramoyl-tripeptide--D-alanyl-D-alanine ligase [Ignavibacteriales bacterium]
MKLSSTDILNIAHVQALGFENAKRFEVTGVSTDSRAVKQGDLFVAIRGERFDGHDFLTKAVESGARALVVDMKWAGMNAVMLSSLTPPRLVVENTVHALGRVAHQYRRKFNIPFLVIGGSNGKTTTKDMITTVLQMKYNVLSTEGNLNNHIGVPQTLFRLEKKHKLAVIEIGTNHFGEIEYLCNVLEPTHALITNIGREHLEFFKSLDGVAKAESEAFEWLRAHRAKKGIGFINSDDKRIVKQAKGLKKNISYGFEKTNATVKGKLLGVNKYACASVEVKQKGKKPFSINLSVPGKHNGHNALAAATVGLAMHVPVKKIQQALSSFAGANKRMQLLELGGITVLNDTYNANPDSVLAALATLSAALTYGKKIVVLADMLELGKDAVNEHQKIGKAVGRHGVEYLLTYGPLAKHTHDAAAVPFKFHYEQKNVLAEYLSELVSKGDIVLVKGSRGMKMEEVVAFLSERVQQST